MSIAEVAEKRGLATSTIEGHLAHFIIKETLPLSALIPEEKAKKGFELIAQNDFDGLTELKQIAGDEFSYGELRILIALQKKQSQ